jgi:hypothetical protein
LNDSQAEGSTIEVVLLTSFGRDHPEVPKKKMQKNRVFSSE